jgi:hypothetical protein
VGFVMGLFVGCALGLLSAGLCSVAARSRSGRRREKSAWLVDGLTYPRWDQRDKE